MTPDEATWTRPEQRGRALPPSEFRPQPDQGRGPRRAGGLGWQREGVQRRAAEPPRGIFVTGTDTGVGKTVVSALLTLALPHACYWKPIQSGLPPAADSTDRDDVARWTGLPAARLLPEAYRLKLPASPHVSAAAECIAIERARLALPPAPGPVVVEGAGGVMVPINGEALMLDLMAWLALPIVLVARTALGTINHTLLSLEALRHRGLAVALLVLNGEPVPSTIATLKKWGNVPLLAELSPMLQLDPEHLAAAAAKLPDLRSAL